MHLLHTEDVGRKSYKDALLSPVRPRTINSLHLEHSKVQLLRIESKDCHNFVSKRFRCLGSDHKAADCKDPIKCYQCSKTDHKASRCSIKPLQWHDNMLRANRAREHVSPLRSSCLSRRFISLAGSYDKTPY